MSEIREQFERALDAYGLSPLMCAVKSKHFASDLTFHALKAQSQIDTMREYCGDLPDLHFGFLDDATLNAWAFVHDDHHFIAMHAGTILLLDLFFFRLMSDPRILPHIGDIGLESPTAPLDPSTLVDALFESVNKKMVVFPRDEVRRRFAIHLRELVAEFIIWHEIHHIADGHVDYFSHAYAVAQIREIGYMPCAASQAAALQALEMQAGAGAIARMVRDLLRRTIDPSFAWVRTHQSLAKYSAGLDQWYFNLFFAIDAWFRLGGDSPIPDFSAADSSHPPWRVRHVLASWCAGVALRASGFDDKVSEECFVASAKAAHSLEDAFSVLTGEPRRDFAEMYGTGADYVRSLQDHWSNELRGKVLPFAYRSLNE